MPVKTVFVAMPFGTRTGFLHHAEEDNSKRTTVKFDEVWKGIISKALPEFFHAIRADELKAPGIIDRKYMRHILDSDVVLADLTFANPNVYYEVGIRQALRSAGTVLIACQGTILPFDLRNQTVLYYPYTEAPRIDEFREELRAAIAEAACAADVHSPVHVFLPELRNLLERDQGGASDPRAAALASRLDRETTRLGVIRLSQQITQLPRAPGQLLEALGLRLLQLDEPRLALCAFERALTSNPDDPELLRSIGFCYRKMGQHHYGPAESYLKEAAEKNPHDVEALGMLGGLAKRRGALREAREYYANAHAIAPKELYPLVALGAICVAMGDARTGISYYTKCSTLAEVELKQDPTNYWALLCLAEAALVENQLELATSRYKAALAAHATPEAMRSAMEQVHFLATSLEDSARYFATLRVFMPELGPIE